MAIESHAHLGRWDGELGGQREGRLDAFFFLMRKRKLNISIKKAKIP